MRSTTGFRIFLCINLTGLIVQYLTGMYANMFVAIPDNLPGGNAWGWVHNHSPLILFHVVLGILLVAVSIVCTVFVVRIRDALSITAIIFGVVFLAFAWMNGRNFLNYGQQDVYSYQMAAGFLGAAICHVLAFMRSASIR